MRRAFVSHSSADDSYVAQMESFLRAAGFDEVFNDVSAIQPDEKFWPKIEQGIAACESLVVIITPASNASEWVKREVEFARSLSKKIIPIWREDCPLPSTFADRDVIDFRPRTRAERRFDIGRILKYAPAELVGREEETKQLNEAWQKVLRLDKGRAHVITFVALGGEGKTSLVAKWAVELAAQDWPGCDAVFAWSFYSQGTREQVAASSDLFLKEALTFFGDDADKEFAASAAGAFEKGQRLARIVGRRRSLLILDGLEPLQYAPSSTAFKPGELKDQAMAKLLKDLATTSHGLCIVTSRVEIPDLQAFKGGAVVEAHLKRLSRKAAVDLLKGLGVKGSERRNVPLNNDDPESEKVNEFEKLVEDVKGHALTLTLLGGFLKRAFHGDIRQRDRVKFEKADEKMDGGHAFRTMATYEQWLLRDGGNEGRREVAVLRLLGLFDRPSDAGCLAALLQPPAIEGLTEPLMGIAEDDWNFCIGTLESARLLTSAPDDSAIRHSSFGIRHSLDAHPHLREYFAKQLREKSPDAWRAAHRRLYEHLCATTQEGQQPTLEELQPLYQAVAHGCQAGMQQETLNVFFLRIRRLNQDYTVRRLGAFGSDLGAIACFFENPWDRVTLALFEADQAWALAQAAFYLRALGRLNESLEPLGISKKMDVERERWKRAAQVANNLSELKLTLGEVAGAVRDADESVTYADRSGNVFERMAKRTLHADALHQAGRRAEAEALFREAEQMQAESQPNYPLLYSVRGFKYRELLLAAAERAAWQLTVNSSFDIRNSALPESCRSVSQSAAQIFEWRKHPIWNPAADSLLDIALDHLTLGRAALYEAILEVGAAISGGPGEVTPDMQRAWDSSGAFFPTEAAAVGTSREPALLAFQTARRELNAAVDGLRRSGNVDELARGLLTRAWFRFLTPSTGAGQAARGAQEDLDEAWEISERGPMKLFLADICLYRARLFGNRKAETGNRKEETKYPWESPTADLVAAEKLINDCGYHRRDEELADAKLALLGA